MRALSIFINIYKFIIFFLADSGMVAGGRGGQGEGGGKERRQDVEEETGDSSV